MDDQSIKDVLNSLWSEGERDSASVAVQMEMVAARRRSSTMCRGSGLSADKTAGTGINAAPTCFFPADNLPHRPVPSDPTIASSFRLFSWGSSKARQSTQSNRPSRARSMVSLHLACDPLLPV